MMKKSAKGWLMGLGILVILVGGVGIWQRENIKFIYEAKKYKPEEIQQNYVKAQEEVQKVLSQYELEGMRELTEEEKSELASEELSIDEAAKRLLEPSAEVSVVEPAVGEEQEGTESTPEGQQKGPTEQEIVTTYTAKMYALQSKYTGKLSAIESQGWELLNSYTSGSQPIKELMPQGMTLVQQAMSLESQCDGEVETILQNLTKELNQINADQAIVETMRSAYQAEKSARKSYYLSLIPER